MGISVGNLLFNSDLWNRALESYAGAANLTVKLFNTEGQLVFGPVNPTPLFQLFDAAGAGDPGLFEECARGCLAQTTARPALMVSRYGLSVVGSSLVLDGEVVGAAVAGYAFVDFSQISEVQHLARQSGINFERLWRVAREQKPVPQRRLIVNGELLQVLGDALLRENRRTRQYGTALSESEAQLRALTARLLTSQEEERRRLARELHDGTMQRFAVLENRITLLRMALPDSERATGDQLETIQSELGSMCEEVRNVSHRLHPAILDDLGLEIAIKQLVTDFGARTSQGIRFRSEGVPETIAPDIAATLYRVTQEALGNIRKHASQASVIVTLLGFPDRMELSVEDNGPGFDSTRNPERARLGLISMQERVLSVKGHLTVTSSLGHGTKLDVVIPCKSDL